MKVQVKSEVLEMFPTPLVVVNYPYDYSDELKWIQSCDYNVSVSGATRRTKDTFLLDRPQLTKVREFIEFMLSKYMNEIYGSSTKLRITQCWANRTSKGQNEPAHYHTNSIVSGVWYPKFSSDHPSICFHKEIINKSIEFVSKDNKFISNSNYLTPEVGDIILFPSNLTHSVEQNRSDEERISLSFNTWLEGSMGSVSNLSYIPEEVRR